MGIEPASKGGLLPRPVIVIGTCAMARRFGIPNYAVSAAMAKPTERRPSRLQGEVWGVETTKSIDKAVLGRRFKSMAAKVVIPQNESVSAKSSFSHGFWPGQRSHGSTVEGHRGTVRQNKSRGSAEQA